MSFGPSRKKLGPTIVVGGSKKAAARPKVRIEVEVCLSCGNRVPVLFGDWSSDLPPRECAECVALKKVQLARAPRVAIEIPSDLSQEELVRLTKKHLEYLARVRGGKA